MSLGAVVKKSSKIISTKRYKQMEKRPLKWSKGWDKMILKKNFKIFFPRLTTTAADLKTPKQGPKFALN